MKTDTANFALNLVSRYLQVISTGNLVRPQRQIFRLKRLLRRTKNKNGETILQERTARTERRLFILWSSEKETEEPSLGFLVQGAKNS
jgi:hypothetical protein